ncbi:MAG: OmpA family protein, partial [Paramuribaculum sp.]|nr:OmpA family protein [Paramuribaculum sp.]
MKKFKSLLLAGTLVLSTFAASAQTIQRTVIEEEKVVFAPHWFLQVQGGAAETLGEGAFGDLISPAAALNIGYRFSPVFSLRAGASGWQAKGIATTTVNNVYKFNYIQANVDAVVSLTNLFCGWNPKRTLDFYGFLGVGANDRFHNNDALDLARNTGYDFVNRWDGNKWAFTGRGGRGVHIRLRDYGALNVAATANGL